MKLDAITFELLTQSNIAQVREIQRDDVSEAFVDTVDTIMALTQYGLDHHCKGHTYAIKQENEYIGLILLGEALAWDTDPEEMKGVPFYRLMGFVVDKRYRNRGIGGYALEKAIDLIYAEFGTRPIALGVHKDNSSAERFYRNHGFRKTDVMEGNDYYYLRYPNGTHLHFDEDQTMFEITQMQSILSHFGLSVHSITNFYDTSHNDDDQRLNYILDDKYVLKINSVAAMWETRLQEIHRLIVRYRSIGVYCPDLIPALDGSFSYVWQKDGKEYTCFVEEYAIYPVLGAGVEYDCKEVVAHLGILAANYTGIDLSETKSMWSIIDLAPLDVDIDEKQENANALIDALRKNGYDNLASKVEVFHAMLREKIMVVFRKLPRCVYQGDLNSTNILHKDGHFIGLIDFNMAGTDVNINVFLNETNWFPEEAAFDVLSVPEIIAKQDSGQAEALSVILQHYTLNDDEKYALAYYKRIVDMFQYPTVCRMVEWLDCDTRKDKCAEWITALIEKPL